MYVCVLLFFSSSSLVCMCVCMCYGAVMFSSALLKFPINQILGVSDHTNGDYIFF